MSGERTEKATPRRRHKAEEDGDRVMSRELVTAASTLAGVSALGMAGERWAGAWSMAYQQSLELGLPKLWSDARLMATFFAMRHIVVEVLSPVLLLFAAAWSGAFAAGAVQGGGFTVHPKALAWKFNRLNPVENIKNLFSMRAVSRLFKSLLPAGVLTALAWGKLREQTALPVMSLVRLPLIFTAAYELLRDAAWISFAWAGVDFAVEWRSREARLKMSKQELRDEYKETEGNPQIRSRIRGLQRQMRRRKLKADVRRATVVVTNPTHYAVALSFDFDTMEAPKVMAKGRDLLAEQIKSEARWAGVPIVENPPLARSLYRLVEPGQAIPVDLYAAVAAILAYLYRQQVEEKVREERRRKQTAPIPARRASKEAGGGPGREAASQAVVAIPTIALPAKEKPIP